MCEWFLGRRLKSSQGVPVAQTWRWYNVKVKGLIHRECMNAKTNKKVVLVMYWYEKNHIKIKDIQDNHGYQYYHSFVQMT